MPAMQLLPLILSTAGAVANVDWENSSPGAARGLLGDDPVVVPAPSASPMVDAPAMTDWGSDTTRCFSTLGYYIGEAPTLASCWTTCYATFGLELVAVDMDTDNYCYCQNDCMCMDSSWGGMYHTATLATVSSLPGACGDAPGEGDCCENCPDAIDGGVCYPGKIGKLHPVIQLRNGTIVEIITTICPDVDPGALCANAASKAQFLAPAALAAALLLSL